MKKPVRKDPPERKPPQRGAIYDEDTLNQLREDPGSWYLVEKDAPSRPSTWQPRQKHPELELTTEATGKGYNLYARWRGEED